jgi:hypothetical protein
MPSRKQRRRREKLQRHEYEYVVETEEGEVPLRELEDEDGRRKNGKARETTAGPLDRRGRPIPKPSAQRVLKRTAIFAPILVIFVYLTAGEDLTPVAVVVNALILLAFFIPFSYLVDVVLYRMMMRRHGRHQADKRARR